MERGPHSTRVGDVTLLLRRLQEGDRSAFDRLFPLVYEALRRNARRALAHERPEHTLHATDLVHEAFFKLAGPTPASWQNRAHFLAVAARAMRQVLVEHARRQLADKRGGGVVHLSLSHAGAPPAASEELVALDDALERLGALQPRLRTLVEYRFFGGLSERETAEVLGVSERTVQRDWARARAWLHQEVYSVAPVATSA